MAARKKDNVVPGFGARLRQAYESAGFNRNTFVHALGADYGGVHTRWEGRDVPPVPSMLVRIAELTGFSVDWLLGVDPPGPRVTSDREVYSTFVDWLHSPQCPHDLTDEERESLAQIRFQHGAPDPYRYSVILEQMRARPTRSSSNPPSPPKPEKGSTRGGGATLRRKTRAAFTNSV